ncbi:MAG: T9SS type A sorting domain-containing protein, partial [Bacteroidota bacterium]
PSYSCTWTQNLNNWAYVQINQTTSHPSVSFYEMPVQLKFVNATRDTLITVNNQRNGEIFWINPGFLADTMLVDPNLWILTKNRNVQRLTVKSTTQNDIKIYPNPITDYLKISMLNPTGSQTRIQLFNAVGQLVYSMDKKLTGQDELFIIPVGRLAGGGYVLQVSNDKNMLVKKVVVR